MISNLVLNTYDEYGEIFIREDFDFHNWRKKDEYSKLVRRASSSQIITLTTSILVCLGLFLYSCYLHKKLLFRKAWVPPPRVTRPFAGGYNGDAMTEAGRMSRLQSGIVALRSADSVDGGASQTGGRTMNDISTLTPSMGTFA